MKTTPNVFFNIEYIKPNAPGAPPSPEKSRRDFVSCRTNGSNHFDYLTRKEAVEKNDTTTVNIMETMETHSAASEADLLRYAAERPGSTGAFTKDGDLTKESAAAMRERLQKTESIIWNCVLSFEELYGKKYCPNKAVAQELLTLTMKDLFSKSHLKYENIEWYAALHENTDNQHLHIVFWEKAPTFLQKGSTEYKYANKQKLSKEACDNFKFSVANHLEHEASALNILRDVLRNSFRRNINTGEKNDALLELWGAVKERSSWQFGKQNKETQENIIKLTINIVINNDELKEKYDECVDALMKQQKRYYKICEENKLTPGKGVIGFVDKNIKDLHARLGQDVINALKDFDKNAAGLIPTWADTQALQRNINTDEKSEDLPINETDPVLREIKKQVLQGKQGKLAKKSGNSAKVTKGTTNTRALNKIIVGAFKFMGTSFNKSFQDFQRAIKEQERKRRKLDGLTDEDTLQNE